MSLRTVLISSAAAATLISGGAVASSAFAAAPAPAVAVAASGALTDATDTAPGAGTASEGQVRPRAKAFWRNLTDAQRACLAEAHLTRPAGPLTNDQRATLRTQVEAAAQKCGITLPARRQGAIPQFWRELTDAQLECMRGAGVTRPFGPLTVEQRVTLRSELQKAATGCGVTLPPERGTATQ